MIAKPTTKSTTVPPQRAVRLGDLDAASAAPEDLSIPGFDYPIEKDHPLYKARIRRLLEAKEGAVQDIVRSLKDNPFILHPLLCRKNGKAVEVGVGARRTYGARVYNVWAAQNGKPLVRMPLLIKNWSHAQWQKAIRTENYCREPDDVVDEVETLSEFVNVCQSELSAARALGMKKEELKRLLAVHAMPDAAKALLRLHSVPREVAVIVAALPLDLQEQHLQAMIDRQQVSVAAARAAVVEETSTDSDAKPARPPQAKGPKAPPRPVLDRAAEMAKGRLPPLAADMLLAMTGKDPTALDRVPGLAGLLHEARAELAAQRKKKAAEAPDEGDEATEASVGA